MGQETMVQVALYSSKCYTVYNFREGIVCYLQPLTSELMMLEIILYKP